MIYELLVGLIAGSCSLFTTYWIGYVMNKLFFKHENMSKKEYIKLGLVCIVVGGLIVAACIVLGGLILGTI